MLEQLEALLRLVAQLPVETGYLAVGIAAAVENLFPPVPSDLIVVVGGVLADRGIMHGGLVFGVAWASNLVLALVVYASARRYGKGIFDTRWGRWLLRPGQLRRMAAFYDEYGTITILVSRFFPVFRVLVPAFAGISRLGFWRTAIPLAVASAIWYGLLVGAGILASRNIPPIVRAIQAVNVSALLVAALLGGLLVVLWWRSRRSADEG
ncbi:MAG: DedA family protein [Gemmatimonadota bacterium]